MSYTDGYESLAAESPSTWQECVDLWPKSTYEAKVFVGILYIWFCRVNLDLNNITICCSQVELVINSCMKNGQHIGKLYIRTDSSDTNRMTNRYKSLHHYFKDWLRQARKDRVTRDTQSADGGADGPLMTIPDKASNTTSDYYNIDLTDSSECTPLSGMDVRAAIAHLPETLVDSQQLTSAMRAILSVGSSNGFVCMVHY